MRSMKSSNYKCSFQADIMLFLFMYLLLSCQILKLKFSAVSSCMSLFNMCIAQHVSAYLVIGALKLLQKLLHFCTLS
jgi:hypothetical protein